MNKTKLKQEEIDKMAQIMCGFCTEDKRCILKYSAPCSEVASQDCTCKESAEELIHKGYGKVSEYKAEIERPVKQTQTDTINTIVKYCENPNHWNELKDCKLWGGKSDDLRDFLNGILRR